MKSPFIVGEKVIDDLTGEKNTIVGISYKHGICGDDQNHYYCWGIWIDNPYLDGGRLPWELTRLEKP